MRTTNNNLRAGLFITLALVSFMFIIVLLGGERHIFSDTEQYFTTFRNVGGLSEGAPVRLGGITVGRVSAIEFTADPYDHSVLVGFAVETEYLERIRANSVISIETQGLLGDKFLSISSGMTVSSEPVLEPGSKVKGAEPADFYQVLEKAQQVVDNVVKISASVDDVLQEVRYRTLDDFSAGIESFNKITAAIEKGDGLVSKLFYSKEDGEKIINSISEASDTVSELLKEVETGHGLLHTLIYDPAGKTFVSSVTKAADELAKTSESISSIAQEIQSGDGVFHQLVYDDGMDVDAKINEAVANFNAASAALKRASEALANGNGTIGALLVDPSLYDNLVQITDGAKKSTILRYAIKSSLNK